MGVSMSCYELHNSQMAWVEYVYVWVRVPIPHVLCILCVSILFILSVSILRVLSVHLMCVLFCVWLPCVCPCVHPVYSVCVHPVCVPVSILFIQSVSILCLSYIFPMHLRVHPGGSVLCLSHVSLSCVSLSCVWPCPFRAPCVCPMFFLSVHSGHLSCACQSWCPSCLFYQCLSLCLSHVYDCPTCVPVQSVSCVCHTFFLVSILGVRPVPVLYVSLSILCIMHLPHVSPVRLCVHPAYFCHVCPCPFCASVSATRFSFVSILDVRPLYSEGICLMCTSVLRVSLSILCILRLSCVCLPVHSVSATHFSFVPIPGVCPVSSEGVRPARVPVRSVHAASARCFSPCVHRGACPSRAADPRTRAQ